MACSLQGTKGAFKHEPHSPLPAMTLNERFAPHQGGSDEPRTPER